MLAFSLDQNDRPGPITTLDNTVHPSRVGNLLAKRIAGRPVHGSMMPSSS